MIEIKNMDFGYVSQRKIFDNLNLSLEAGHIYGLLGKNGVGKTTLLKIISGLRFCNSGTVSVLGMKPEHRKPEMLADIYFVTEEMDVPTVSVRDYAKIYAPFYPNFSTADFEDYLHQFEIVNLEQKLTKMSHGQKKKVLVSFALATNTKLLIMDEPTNGMDIPSNHLGFPIFHQDKNLFLFSLASSIKLLTYHLHIHICNFCCNFEPQICKTL